MSPKRKAPWGYADLYLSLGSNLGDREANIREALKALNRSYGRYKAVSGIIETEPQGFESENRFLNAAVKVLTTLSPEECLKRTQQIERELGRKKKSKNGVYHDRPIDIDLLIYHDRPIDIDILFYGSLRTEDSIVTVPHPRMKERDFVMIPLREIATPTLRRMFPEYF